jgi:signal peptidase I
MENVVATGRDRLKRCQVTALQIDDASSNGATAPAIDLEGGCHWQLSMKCCVQVSLALLLASSLLSGCSSLPSRTLVFQGPSMLPTIKDGQRLRRQTLDAESKAKLVRGDIVAFESVQNPARFYIKRLIALSGDTVEIRDGEVWLNGSKLSEPYVDAKLNQSPRSLPVVTVPAKSYYVLGDNRDNSSDSRSWGFVSEDLVFAKVVNQ